MLHREARSLFRNRILSAKQKAVENQEKRREKNLIQLFPTRDIFDQRLEKFLCNTSKCPSFEDLFKT